MPPSSSHDNSQPGIQLGLLALGVVGFCLLLGNTAFTVLKETPLFWRNSGGYSVGLRQLVLSWYYPLLGLNCILCAVYSCLAAARQSVSSRSSLWTITVAVLLWAMLFLNLGLLTANNLQNVLSGRPVHYHPAVPQR
jgi:hypothetical protein